MIVLKSKMEAIAFAGSHKGVADAIAYDKQPQKRVRQPLGEKRQQTPKVGSKSDKSDPSQASRKDGTGGNEKASPFRNKGRGGCDHYWSSATTRVGQGEDAPWTKVE